MTAESILKKPGIKKPGLKKSERTGPGPWSKLGDRINPIVVKELRQAVQRRGVFTDESFDRRLVTLGDDRAADDDSGVLFERQRQAF